MARTGCAFDDAEAPGAEPVNGTASEMPAVVIPARNLRLGMASENNDPGKLEWDSSCIAPSLPNAAAPRSLVRLDPRCQVTVHVVRIAYTWATIPAEALWRTGERAREYPSGSGDL